jgi:hypothetical protein
MGCQVLQGTQHLAQFSTVPLDLVRFLVALLIGSPHLGLTLLDVSIGSGFHLPDFSPQEILWHILQLQFALAIIDDPIQRLSTGIGLLVEAVVAFTRLVFTLACASCLAL